jgi:hypothetical protein
MWTLCRELHELCARFYKCRLVRAALGLLTRGLSGEASRDTERSVDSEGWYTAPLANNHVQDCCPTS